MSIFSVKMGNCLIVVMTSPFFGRCITIFSVKMGCQQIFMVGGHGDHKDPVEIRLRSGWGPVEIRFECAGVDVIAVRNES